ncbi:hypothetical protein SAMN02982929_00801 [Saccharopolyspora kobensis]|uniref:Uncharacterized protein n=1 Tax=Saccharopolyspora kobensis TaxID=146035 RepID=A0A1H5V8P7_9PSEU|nr:hypothetical protein SAMN02982929_00801 [Saccharopolyspora kobensis]SFC63868.1 hypothetical protein SAMN05216506_1011269 [Saccharopolyspora kobensis]
MGGHTIRLFPNSTITPHRNFTSRHAGNALSPWANKTPGFIIIIRSNIQRHTAPLESDHEIPSASHLSRANDVARQFDEMGSCNTWGLGIERYLIPDRELEENLGLYA